MNEFNTDLAFSHSAEDSEIWPTIYSKAFPRFKAMTNTRDDGQLQRAGIDRTIVLASGKAIYVDEKVRRKDYGDILVEYVSNDRKNTPGWGEKPLFCDFIAYAILPSRKCFILPVIQLQTAWAEHKNEWLEKYGIRKAVNTGYNTLNCPVLINVLFKAIGQALRVDY